LVNNSPYSNLTINISKELKDEMKKYKEVNWSEVCRRAILDYIKTRKNAEFMAKMYMERV